MATFTITTPVNMDSLSGKAGSDTYNINGGYLTVDQHTRYGVNQSPTANIGNIILSATLGGTLEINSTKVRIVAFTGGSGNVPAQDAVISQGGASGKMLAVYDIGFGAPLTPGGAAMPSAGYLLVRQWNSVSYAAGALTGIGANASEPDRPGFLEINSTELLTLTVNRLNKVLMRGDWYDFFGVATSGSPVTTYQLPHNGALMFCPGVEVETATPGVYEFYANAGTKLASGLATDEVRGRWCWISNLGLVTFGYDGSTLGGYIPPAGRKLRVANIFLQNTAAAAPGQAALPHATLASRYEFATTGGGVIEMDKVSCGWYMNFSQPYSVKLDNVTTFETINLSECASPISWSNVSVGQSAANSQTALTMSFNFAGGTMDKCTWTRAALASSSNYVQAITDCVGFTVTNERVHGLTKAGNAAAGSTLLTRVVDSTWDKKTIGAGQVWQVTCNNVKHKDSTYYDHPLTTTAAAIPFYAFSLSTACVKCSVDGLDFGGLPMVQPYSGILNVLAAGCADTTLRNLGSSEVPLSLGAPRKDLVAYSRAGTVATVTDVAHGLKVGDQVYVPVSDSVAAIVAGLKTIATVPTANTFTFSCLNAGNTSGVISYFPTVCGSLFVLASGAAANGLRVQNCLTLHTRTNLFTGDNSSKNIQIDNVISDYLNPFLVPMLNCRLRGVSGTPPLTAQTSVYGTHWMDVFNADVTPNLVDQAWTRSGFTVTVTCADHKLRTGLFINVNESSNLVGVPRGIKTVTVLNANTFTFTGVNSGATSGTLTFRTVIDRIILMMNEATADTAGQYTITSGNPGFTSAGGLFMPTVGDSITFQMPDFLLGHTSFPIQEVVMLGGTIANYKLEYQLDKGAGYEGWNNLYYTRVGGTGTSGQFTFNVTDATGVAVGDYVWGTGIGGNAKVLSIAGNTITVDNANSATVSGTIRFNHLRSESGITEAGFKLSVRITTVTANTTAMTSLSIYTDTDDASRALRYPLDVNTVTFTGLHIGTDVVVLSAGTATVLDSVDQISETSYSFTYSGAQNIDVGFIKTGYEVFYLRNLPLDTTDSSLPVSLKADRNFV